MKDQKLYLNELSKITKSHEIEKYSEINFLELYAPFEGYPKKHPYDKNKFVVFADPFSTNAPFYEFPITAIGRIDELEAVTSQSGESGIRVRVWVKRGTEGVLSRTMRVD